MRSIFGWSYPPGCSGPPDDGPEFCFLCGKGYDDCACPECPTCHENGCVTHLEIADLLGRAEAAGLVAHNLQREITRRSIEQAVTCEKCGAKIPRDFLDGMEWCDDCKALVGRPKDEHHFVAE